MRQAPFCWTKTTLGEMEGLPGLEYSLGVKNGSALGFGRDRSGSYQMGLGLLQGASLHLII
jgi:hypothetical protein